ncbi:TIGR00730 family Rossman fold protein [uncultured Maricaulis sp.]|uniref:LOG family protein n=1 Tax=uncultured Maricaulis sp. TaxID=174710 RepID=UPI00261ECD86|nr:TIGR00730 family Rossman fold protein [uncultured Maricaulis sp.]
MSDVTMAKLRSIGVFCGSRMGERKSYADAAEAVGRAIAQAECRLVYGGGDVGLMGISASTAAAEGGSVYGIIPGFLIAREGHLEGVEIKIVETMSERKSLLIAESDAYIILPGGTGTLEEVFDVISRQQLGLQDKPIVFLNTDGFWAPFIDLIAHTVKEGFTPQSLADHVDLIDRADLAIARICAQLDEQDTAKAEKAD